jgi:hypothetical protein
MKILTVCLGGQVRSVAMANYLIANFGINAVPQGTANPFPGNFNWYTQWADKIIVMQPEYAERCPAEKVLICDVGPDTWGNPGNVDLEQKIKDWCEQNKDKLV